jgi:hypothetical protein
MKIDVKQLNGNYNKFLNQHPMLSDFRDNLEKFGDVILFGGAVRDFGHYNKAPRDIDIVINTSNPTFVENFLFGKNVKKNRFGGYKVKVSSLSVDIWLLPFTWAFREGIVEVSVEKLTKTVFLNFDSIVFDTSNQKIYDGGFSESIETNTLDIILEKNPSPTLNILRTLVYIDRYKFYISNGLSKYMQNWIKQYSDINIASEELYRVQWSHYEQVILSRHKILSYLSLL